MGIHTFLRQEEIERFTYVSDLDLNALYQEVRALSNNTILLEERKIVIKRFFRKPITKTLYTLYNYIGSLDAQIINFAQDHKWSINTDVTASYIYTYFYGYFNGHMHGKGYESSKQNAKS